MSHLTNKRKKTIAIQLVGTDEELQTLKNIVERLAADHFGIDYQTVESEIEIPKKTFRDNFFFSEFLSYEHEQQEKCRIIDYDKAKERLRN